LGHGGSSVQVFSTLPSWGRTMISSAMTNYFEL
jgi:hypothetical protein